MAKGIITRKITITEAEQMALREIFWALESMFEGEDIADYPNDVYDILEGLTRITENTETNIWCSFQSYITLKVEEEKKEENKNDN